MPRARAYGMTNPSMEDLTILKEHSVYKFYYRVSKEIIKAYYSKKVDPNSIIKQSLKEEFIRASHIYPIPLVFISELLGLSRTYFHAKFGNIKKGKTFVELSLRASQTMYLKLSDVFNTNLAKDLIYNYFKPLSQRHSIFFSIHNIFYQYTKKNFGTNKLSKIIYGVPSTISSKLSRSREKLGDSSELNFLWQLEYYISKIKPNKKIGFDVSLDTIKDIIRDCKTEIRSHIPIRNPLAFKVLWDSLYFLSDKEGDGKPIKINDLSDKIAPNDVIKRRHYLTKIFSRYNVITFPPVSLKKLYRLISKQAPRNHFLVQNIEHYLENKGLDGIDFATYYEILNKPLSLKTELTEAQRRTATMIVWALSCKRDWVNGKKVPYDENTVLHHIRHDEFGLTIKTDNRIINFALLTQFTNGKVEGSQQEMWEFQFIETWVRLLEYDPNDPNSLFPFPHWDPKIRKEFIEERKSLDYLDNWIEYLNQRKVANEKI